MATAGWKERKIRYQWQIHQLNPVLSRKTGFDYPYDKSLTNKSPMPIVGGNYLYVGGSNESNTHGYFYKVVDIAYHWYDNKLAVFVTTDGFPKTDDTDYCWSMNPEMFIKLFRGEFR